VNAFTFSSLVLYALEEHVHKRPQLLKLWHSITRKVRNALDKLLKNMQQSHSVVHGIKFRATAQVVHNRIKEL
jgi:hypothetical protein